MNDIKRVILKLSGEALSGDKKSGYDDELIMDIAGQVKQIIDKGINVGVVIGGGNYWRGRSNDNIDRTKADQIGMLATIMNCIYVSEIFMRRSFLRAKFFCRRCASGLSASSYCTTIPAGTSLRAPRTKNLQSALPCLAG